MDKNNLNFYYTLVCFKTTGEHLKEMYVKIEPYVEGYTLYPIVRYVGKITAATYFTDQAEALNFVNKYLNPSDKKKYFYKIEEVLGDYEKTKDKVWGR